MADRGRFYLALAPAKPWPRCFHDGILGPVRATILGGAFHLGVCCRCACHSHAFLSVIMTGPVRAGPILLGQGHCWPTVRFTLRGDTASCSVIVKLFGRFAGALFVQSAFYEQLSVRRSAFGAYLRLAKTGAGGKPSANCR